MQKRRIFAHTRSAFLTLCFLLLLARFASAQAQQPTGSTKGFSLGGHVTFASSDAGEIRVQGETVEARETRGTGGGLIVAYGFTEWLTVYLNGDGIEDDADHVLSHGDLGVQAFLRPGRRLRPHLDLSVTGRRVELDAGETIDRRGAGVSVGGGILYFLSPEFALDASLLRSFGGLGRSRGGRRVGDSDDVEVSSTRVNVGIRWYPGR